MIQLKAGDSKGLRVTLKSKSTGNVIDISNVTFIWRLADKAFNEFLIEKNSPEGITVIDGPNGIFQIKIEPEDTSKLRGEYYHECKMIDFYGNRSTILSGKIFIDTSLIK